jgi:hypothetical protein
MGRPKLSIRVPKRERETIAAEIAQLKLIISKCREKPGFAQRVQEAEARLVECQAELEKLSG